jgi:hypothetical protein
LQQKGVAACPECCGIFVTRRESARWTGEAGNPAAARDQFAILPPDRIVVVGADTLRIRHNAARWTSSRHATTREGSIPR